MKRADFEEYVEACLICILGRLRISEEEMLLARKKVEEDKKEIKDNRLKQRRIKALQSGKEPRKKRIVRDNVSKKLFKEAF